MNGQGVDLQAELEARRDFVARLEQERADLQIELDEFRQMYTARVGSAQAELESLELHIAEYQLRNELVRLRGNLLDAARLEAEVDWQLRGRREQFTGYQESVRQAERAECAARVLEPAMQLDLRALYRDLAKRTHPDLATDETDRTARGILMAEINAAYARFDLVALRAISARLDASERDGQSTGAVALRAEIERLEGVISTLRGEIARLNQSDWMAMKIDAALARSRGFDWFDQARRHILARTAERRRELDRLVAAFRELVQQAGLV
jgi:hypothetical protein